MQAGSTRTYFLYDGGVPVLEMDALGNVTRTVTFGPNGLLSSHVTGQPSVFYTFDDLGLPALRLGPGQNVLTSHGFDAYGSNFISLSPPNDPYGYYGAQYGYYTDLETGLQLLTNRYYDASNGRFLTRDPIGTAGGQNLYEYTSDNPVGGIDPSGLDGWLRDAVDGFSGWVSGQVDSAKQFLFERTPIFISWPVANGLDLAKGLLHFPSAIAHLGEGFGAYAGDPSKPENQIAAWGDVGTACSLGLSGVLGAGGFGSRTQSVIVSRWGRPGLEDGDWVMRGGPNRWNYIKSGKWQPSGMMRGTNFANEFAPFSSGRQFIVSKSSLRWPGSGIIDGVKGILGQRIFKP